VASWVASVREGLARAGDHEPRFIGARDARRCVSLADAVALVRDGVLWEGTGRVAVPEARRLLLRLSLPGGDPGLAAMAKCCVVPELGVAGYRFVGSIGGEDPVRYVHIVSLEQRRLLATIDEHLTYLLRIAALAVVAAAHTVPVARPTVGMVGAGRLARAVLEGLIEAGAVGKIVVASRQPASRDGLVRTLRDRGFEHAYTARDVRDAAAQADFLVTATTASAPILSSGWVKPGATVYGLGAAAELPEDLLVRAERGPVRLVVSNWRECAERADIRRLIAAGRLGNADVDAELWEIIAGTKPAREHAGEIVCLRAPGSVALDVLLGAWVCARQAMLL